MLLEVGSSNIVRFVMTVAFVVLLTASNASAHDPSLGSTAAEKTASKEPSQPRLYDGLTLEAWRERIKSLDPAASESVNAVPGLLTILRDADAPWFSRRQAALTLGRMGTKAERAVPAIRKLLSSESDDENTRLWAIKSLALFGPVAADSTPQLVEILNDEQASFLQRAACVDALGRIGSAHPSAINALAELLSYHPSADSDVSSADAAQLRALAAEGIALNGAIASSVVPSLVRALRDQSELVRRETAGALGAIGPSAEVAIPNLVETVVFDEIDSVQDAAANALGKIGPSSLEDLIYLLSDPEAEIRWRAANAIGQMGQSARRAIVPLRKAADDKNAIVRIMALEAIWTVGRNKDDVLERLHLELANTDRQIRIRSVRLILEIARQEAEIIETIEIWAEQDQPIVQRAARQILQKLYTNRP